jgi:hypothetical protein
VQLYGANRRAHRRISAVVQGDIRIFEEQRRPFSTLDISETSLRVNVNTEVAVNSLLEFTLDLPEHGQKVTAHGRVIRADPSEGGMFELAISIVDIDSREHLALKRYLRSLDPGSPGVFESK